MKTGLYGRDVPGDLDAVNGGCLRARLPGFSPGQGQLTPEFIPAIFQLVLMYTDVMVQGDAWYGGTHGTFL